MRFLFSFLSLFFFSQIQASDSLHWTQDYPSALMQAKKEGKPLFLYFTGSDWCPWCKKMDNEILKDPVFGKALHDKLVFVLIDSPFKTQQPREVMEQNKQLKATFHVDSFPTVILLSPKEKVIARMGYQAIGGERYAKMVENGLSKK